MKPNYKLTTAQNNTTTISWPGGTDHDDTTYGALMRLCDVSGVKLTQTFITIPFNCWSLSAGVDLCNALGFAIPKARVDGAVPPWQPKRKLFKHQEVAIELFLRVKRGLLCDSMGLAKSATSIVWAKSVQDHYAGRPFLIVAKKTLQGNWLKELLLAGAIESENDITILEGLDSKKPFDRTKKIFLLNPELVRDWWSELSKLRPCAVIYDEAHAYKDDKSSRAIGAKMIAAAPYVLLLTGSPMPNRPQELWPLLDILYPYAFGNKFAFMVRYCGAVHNGYGLQATGVTHADELMQRISSFYLRRTELDAGVVIPKLTRSTNEVTWNDTHARANYEAIFKSINMQDVFDAIIEGRGGLQTLAMLAALRKATSSAKLHATIEYVKALQADGESVVVFCWQRVTATHLATKLNGVAVTGALKAADRSAAVETFQQKGGVLVATYDTLAEGVTLTKARYTILHDLHWVPKDILQAEKRINRIGQTLPCFSVWMTLKNSVDELFAIALSKKLEAISQLVDGGATDLLNTVELVGSAKQKVEDDVRSALKAWVLAK